MAHIIIRIYRVPGTMYEATDRFREAIILGVEKDYHVKDLIKPAEDKTAKSQQIDLRPPTGWLTLLVKQLTGN